MSKKLDKLMDKHANIVKNSIYNWVAMEIDGFIYAFHNKPFICLEGGGWASGDGKFINIGYTKVKKNKKIWHKSLRKIER